ncbi:MAG: PDZ domain-containing protein [Clostridia bacterium]|nr:PDZ domain-containing protein [Clostridia bacterium]
MKKVVGTAILVVLALLLAIAVCRDGTEQKDAPPGVSGAGLVLLEETHGLYVLAVIQDSPADHAGIKPGDTLLRTTGEPLTQTARLETLIDAHRPLPLQLRRDGGELWVQLNAR